MMKYMVKQITNKFGFPVSRPIFNLESINPIKVGTIYWSNNISNDELTGKYEVIEQIVS